MNTIVRLFSNSSVTQKAAALDKIPDTCPICHKGVELSVISGFANAHRWSVKESLQIVLQCPREVCQRFSVAYYSALDSTLSAYRYQYNLPVTNEPRVFSESIQEISPEFISIYNQSLEAENKGLDKIIGVGYRKALEFMIKDYLIKNNPDKEKEIKDKFLGKCIEDYVTDQRIKSVSKRAAWLGNDETHYVRKWDGKDVNDLKMLIDLTLYWIDSAVLTAKLEVDMPKETKK